MSQPFSIGPEQSKRLELLRSMPRKDNPRYLNPLVHHLSNREIIILDCFSENATTLKDAALMLDQQVYNLRPVVKKLIELGYLERCPFKSGKEELFIKRVYEKTPYVYPNGPAKNKVTPWDIVCATTPGTNSNTANAVRDFPEVLLFWYSKISEAQIQGKLNREDYVYMRKQLIDLKTKLENWQTMLEKLIEHPAFSNNYKIAAELLFESDQPVTRDEILAQSRRYKEDLGIKIHPRNWEYLTPEEKTKWEKENSK